MTKFKKLLLMMLLVGAMTVMAGCGNDDGNTTDASQSTSQTNSNSNGNSNNNDSGDSGNDSEGGGSNNGGSNNGGSNSGGQGNDSEDSTCNSVCDFIKLLIKFCIIRRIVNKSCFNQNCWHFCSFKYN